MPQTELKHFGVKGMRWGIRKPEDSTGLESSGKQNDASLSKQNSVRAGNLRKRLIAKGADEESFKRDYGDQSFFQRHKTGIAIGAGVAGAVALGGAAYYLNKKGLGSYLRGGLNESLTENWRTPVHLSTGSILTRVSTVAETTPNPKGFYCAFRKDDVTRYRATFSGFVGASKGISNEYQALKPVKAPSGFQTVQAFKELAHKDPEFAKLVVGRGGISGSASLKQITERQWHTALRSHASSWSADPDGPETVKFFSHLASKGYNAVIDLNNAGVISQTPLRVIDGTGFKVARSTKLTPDVIKEALDFYENDPMLHFHGDRGITFGPNEHGTSLTHFGIPGMKWGRRKSRFPSNFDSRPSEKLLKRMERSDHLQRSIQKVMENPKNIARFQRVAAAFKTSIGIVKVGGEFKKVLM